MANSTLSFTGCFVAAMALSVACGGEGDHPPPVEDGGNGEAPPGTGAVEVGGPSAAGTRSDDGGSANGNAAGSNFGGASSSFGGTSGSFGGAGGISDNGTGGNLDRGGASSNGGSFSTGGAFSTGGT